MTTASRRALALRKRPRNSSLCAARVDVGGVEEVDAEIEGLPEEGLALLFVEGPGVAAGRKGRRGGYAVGHAAEADAGDFQAGLAEIDVVHSIPLAEGPPYPGGILGVNSLYSTVC